MGDLQWYAPESLDHAAELLRQEGVSAHGGGTSLLRGSLAGVRGLVDLSGLDLDSIMWGGKSILHAGAMVTYARLAEECATAAPVITRALSQAATTPLRNRITIGGTVRSAPLWSDLIGPLVALDAEVVLHAVGPVPIHLYAGNRQYRDALVTGIRIPVADFRYSYYREARTRVDYPAFTVTVLLSIADGSVRSARIVVAGTKNRWDRLTELEESLAGRPAAEIALDPPAPAAAPAFTDRPHGDGGYLSHCAAVALRRGIARAASQGER